MRRTVLYAALLLCGTGCAEPTAHVVVQLDAAPLAVPGSAEVVALPFDPMTLLDSLTVAAKSQPPAFPELEAELRAFQAPPEADLGETGAAWAATHDSLVRLGDSLSAIDRRAPGYRASYARFSALYQRLAQRGAARDAALQKVRGTVRDLARRAGRAADSLRRWEGTAYAAFDSLAALEVSRTGREVVRAVTGDDGRATIALPSGAWWITTQHPHPANPFLEYVWVVPVRSRAGLPFGVPLLEVNAKQRWRH